MYASKNSNILFFYIYITHTYHSFPHSYSSLRLSIFVIHNLISGVLKLTYVYFLRSKFVLQNLTLHFTITLITNMLWGNRKYAYAFPSPKMFHPCDLGDISLIYSNLETAILEFDIIQETECFLALPLSRFHSLTRTFVLYSLNSPLFSVSRSHLTNLDLLSIVVNLRATIR